MKPDPLTRIRQLRTERSMSQLELAQRAGVSLGTIARLESLHSPDKLFHTKVGPLVRIANALGCSNIEDLFASKLVMSV